MNKVNIKNISERFVLPLPPPKRDIGKQSKIFPLWMGQGEDKKPIYYFLLFVIMLGFSACENPSNPSDASSPWTAAQWIDATIKAHGGELYDHSKVSFTFRDYDYIGIHNQGKFQYERIFEEEETGKVRDLLTNENFVRHINGTKAEIPDSMAFKYSNSVNSVIYFALLPYKLNDPAVNLKDLGEGQIKGKTYHKIQVSFDQEGGGKDFEDVFIYWIDPETHRMDYLAYSYKTDGGGMRFRESYNVRTVAGIRFADYVNYEADPAVSIEKLDEWFTDGKLKELSRIELIEIQVEIL